MEMHVVSSQKEKMNLSMKLIAAQGNREYSFPFLLCYKWHLPLSPHLSLSFSEGGGTLEVAVTGTVVPVNLSVVPGTTLDFGGCPAGSTNTQQIQVGSA